MEIEETIRIALVTKRVAKEKGLSKQDLHELSSAELKEFATATLSVAEYIRNVESSHPYDLSKFYAINYIPQSDTVCVFTDMIDDDLDVVINHKWELHITAREGNLSVDAYHVYNGEDFEDHDYDEDFITGLGWLSANDLEKEEED